MLLLDQVLEVQVVVLMDPHFLVVQQVIHLQQHLPKDNLVEIKHLQEVLLQVVVEPVEQVQMHQVQELEESELIQLLTQVQVMERLAQFQQ